VRVDPAANTWSVVAEFTGSGGATPEGDLVPGGDGKLYGTCVGGGTAGFGSVFAWAESTGLATIVSFTGEGGAAPGAGGVDNGLGLVHTGGLVPDAEGRLYGVAAGGGPGGGGVVFRILPAAPFETWKEMMVGDAMAPDLSDPDFDGMELLAEYALGQSPAGFDATAQLGIDLAQYPDGMRLAIVVPRDPLRHDVRMIVEATADLAGEWTILAESSDGHAFAGPGYVSGEVGGTGVRMVEIRDLANVESFPRRFLRMRFERP